LGELDARLALELGELLGDGRGGVGERLGDGGDRPASVQLAQQPQLAHVDHRSAELTDVRHDPALDVNGVGLDTAPMSASTVVLRTASATDRPVLDDLA